MTTLTRICPGSYRLTRAGFTVHVERFTFGWLARADWNRNTVTDPLDTYRQAKEAALAMLARAPASPYTPAEAMAEMERH